jgi:hypothetical protein
MSMNRPHFRFEDLEVWKPGRGLALQFHQLAATLDKRKSIDTPNNSAVRGFQYQTTSPKALPAAHTAEFTQFLNIASPLLI